jgi:carboxypeptidase D
VDQPAGTGYSYVSTNGYVHELDVAADHVVDFLKRFYRVFPEFQNMDVRGSAPCYCALCPSFTQTYIAGESFAGQYIPYAADAILSTSEIETPLKGCVTLDLLSS